MLPLYCGIRGKEPQVVLLLKSDQFWGNIKHQTTSQTVCPVVFYSLCSLDSAHLQHIAYYELKMISVHLSKKKACDPKCVVRVVC